MTTLREFFIGDNNLPHYTPPPTPPKRKHLPFNEALQLLRDLADLQNGSPLVKHEKEYNETMKKVYEFLNTHEMDHTTIEGNKLIAEFMGTVKAVDGYGKSIEVISKSPGNTKTGGKLKYHTSWDWLMPVVEKIEGIGKYHVSIGLYSCCVSEVNLTDTGLHVESDSNSKIEATWIAIVQFLKCYTSDLSSLTSTLQTS